MTRKQVKEILDGLGVSNRFNLKGATFLGRDEYQVLTIKDWQPGPEAQAIMDAFQGRQVVVSFDR